VVLFKLEVISEVDIVSFFVCTCICTSEVGCITAVHIEINSREYTKLDSADTWNCAMFIVDDFESENDFTMLTAGSEEMMHASEKR